MIHKSINSDEHISICTKAFQGPQEPQLVAQRPQSQRFESSDVEWYLITIAVAVVTML